MIAARRDDGIYSNGVLKCEPIFLPQHLYCAFFIEPSTKVRKFTESFSLYTFSVSGPACDSTNAAKEMT
jgi:hypothetical protein